MKLCVPEMSCNHCVAKIEDAILDADEGAQVMCDLETRTVSVGTILEQHTVLSALQSVGFEAHESASDR